MELSPYSKKILLFSIFLFSTAFLFIIYNRLSNGLSLQFFLAFALALCLTAPILIGVWRRDYLSAAGAAFLSGFILAFLINQTSRETAGVSLIFGYPLISLGAALIVTILLLLIHGLSLLDNENRLKTFIKFQLLFLIILLGGCALLLFHCGRGGCASVDFMTKNALQKNSAVFCSAAKTLTDDPVINATYFLPYIFSLDYLFISETAEIRDINLSQLTQTNEHRCLTNYARQKNDITACLLTPSDNRTSCFRGVLEKYPSYRTCDKLAKTADKNLCRVVADNL